MWTGSEMIVWGGNNPAASRNTGGRYNPVSDSWVATSTTNAPLGRVGHTAVWTGSEMIVWGGGMKFEFLVPAENTIPAQIVGQLPAPPMRHRASHSQRSLDRQGDDHLGRMEWLQLFQHRREIQSKHRQLGSHQYCQSRPLEYYHTAVWTGNEMIIWGGWNGSNYFNTGGRYNPSTNSWTATSTTNAPSARPGHTAVWTGSEMIVWGGNNPTQLNTGGRYCPAAPNPTATPTPTSTPTPTPTIIVTNTNDSGPGSLRQALADANDDDIIGFAVTGTIGLTSGELLVAKNITISGPGAENLAVNGNGKSTVFHIALVKPSPFPA